LLAGEHGVVEALTGHFDPPYLTMKPTSASWAPGGRLAAFLEWFDAPKGDAARHFVPNTGRFDELLVAPASPSTGRASSGRPARFEVVREIN
jgi:hypothetical protein